MTRRNTRRSNTRRRTNKRKKIIGGGKINEMHLARFCNDVGHLVNQLCVHVPLMQESYAQLGGHIDALGKTIKAQWLGGRPDAALPDAKDLI